MTSHLVHVHPGHERFDALSRGASSATLAAVAAVLVALVLGWDSTPEAWGLVVGAAFPAGLAPVGRWCWRTRRNRCLPVGHLDPDERAVLAAADAAVDRLEAAHRRVAPGPVADHLALLADRGGMHLDELHRTIVAAGELDPPARRTVWAEAARTIAPLRRLADAAERLATAHAEASADRSGGLAELASATDAFTTELAAAGRPWPSPAA